MTEPWRYFAARNADGTVWRLGRVCRDQRGLWGQYYEDGYWTEHPSVTDFLIDPSYGEPVTAEEAERIISLQGDEL